MYKDSLVIPRWKRIMRKSFAVVAAFTMIFNFGITSALLTPHVAQASPNEESSEKTCPPGNVKYEIDDGYEYNDGSGTISGDEDSVSWTVTPGYTLTDVCVKIGGSHGGELIHPNPNDESYDKGDHDISHVVLYTEQEEPQEGTIHIRKDVRDQNLNPIDTDDVFYLELNGDDSTVTEFTETQPAIFTVPVGVTQTLNEININPNYEFVLFNKDEDPNTPGAQITVTEAGQTVYVLVKNKEVEIKECNFEIVKEGPATADVNGNITYIISYDNNGTANCTGGGVKITDYIPVGTEYVSHNATPTAGSSAFDANTNRVWWNLGTVTPGESGEVTLTVKVLDGEQCEGWQIDNIATFWSNQMTGESNHVYTDVEKACNGDLRIKKYKDLNGNGEKDSGESYMTGWHFTVTQAGQYVADGTTNVGDGNYLIITDLAAGTYDVTETPQNGWTNTEPETQPITKTVTIVPEQLTSVWFGNFENVDITVKKLIDADGNIQTTGDQTLTPNWTVQLWQNGSQVGGDKLTNAQGQYTWTNLGPGTYTVKEVFNTSVYSALTPVEYTFTVTSGNDVTKTFINARDTGSIEVHKVYDMDGNPNTLDDVVYDPNTWTWNLDTHESNIAAGATRTLLTNVNYTISENEDAEYNSSWICDNGQSGTGIVTDNIKVTDGEHITCVFNNIRKFGDVTFEKVVSGGDAVSSDWTFKVGNETYNHNETVSMPTGQYTVTELGPDGYTHTNTSGICSNGSNESATLTVTENGGTCTFTNTRDTGDLKIIKIDEQQNLMQGVEFKVDGTSYYTDSNGAIYFSNLETGDVNVLEVEPSNYSFTSVSGLNCTNSNPSTATVVDNETTTCTFTNTRDTGTLRIKKFVDYNADGIKNGNDTYLTGWKFTVEQGNKLIGTYETGQDPINSDWIILSGIPTGEYTITEIEQNGWTNTTALVQDATVIYNDTTTKYFGNFELGKISGHKYDSEQNLLTGWYIKLDNGDYTWTDQNGYYEFTDLGVGSYVVTEDNPLGWTQLSPTSDNGTYPVTVVSGTDSQNNDFENRLNEFEVDIEKLGPATVDAGDQMTYTLNWEITGNTAVYDATIKDLLPANTTFVSASNGGTENAGTITWDLGDVTPNESGTVTLTVLVATPLTNGTELYNDAQICGSGDILDNEWYSSLQTGERQGFPVKCDDDDTTTVVESAPILGINKVNDNPVIAPTEIINYEVFWSVAGNSQATNVTLTDSIPVEINIDASTISHSGTYDSATRIITWNLGTHVPGDAGSVTYSATSIGSIPNGTQIINIVKITSVETDPIFWEAQSVTTVVSSPVLEIVKDVDYGHALGFANPGDTVTYTVQVTNTGTDTAKKVVLDDTLPAGFLYADTLTPTRSWDLGNIAVGDSVTTTYSVIIGTTVEAGFYDNIAVAYETESDEKVEDDATVEVRVPTPKGETTKPILTIDKTVNVEFVNPGDTVTYTVVISNNGDGAALNVVLTDTLPAEFTFEDGTKTRSWALGTILAGTSQTVVYNVLVGMDVEPGEYLNLAVAKADNHDAIEDIEGVEVRNPRVLGDSVPLTGAGLQDLILFLASLLFIFAGVLFVREGKKQYQTN